MLYISCLPFLFSILTKTLQVHYQTIKIKNQGIEKFRLRHLVLMGLRWTEKVQTEWVKLVLLFKTMGTAIILLFLNCVTDDGNTSLANLAAVSLDIQDLEEDCAVSISRGIFLIFLLIPSKKLLVFLHSTTHSTTYFAPNSIIIFLSSLNLHFQFTLFPLLQFQSFKQHMKNTTMEIIC